MAFTVANNQITLAGRRLVARKETFFTKMQLARGAGLDRFRLMSIGFSVLRY